MKKENDNFSAQQKRDFWKFTTEGKWVFCFDSKIEDIVILFLKVFCSSDILHHFWVGFSFSFSSFLHLNTVRCLNKYVPLYHICFFALFCSCYGIRVKTFLVYNNWKREWLQKHKRKSRWSVDICGFEWISWVLTS